MVESNVTLDAETILSALNKTTNLQDTNGAYTVTLLHSEVIAGIFLEGFIKKKDTSSTLTS